MPLRSPPLPLLLLTFSSLLSLANSANTGNDGCPCVEWAELDDYRMTYGGESCLLFSPTEGMLTGGDTSNAFCYPPHYGSTECKAWDEDLEPFCADSSGNSLAHAPDWCADHFCYVDPNNCDSIVSRSGMFPDVELYYSYATCGSKNSFVDWLDNPNGADLTKVSDAVENYLFTSTAILESSYAELAGATDVGDYCTLPESCSCQNCALSLSWGCQKVDFTEANVIFGCKNGVCIDKTRPDAERAQCLGRELATQYQRVATKEYNDLNRIGYQYFGDHDAGVMVQWPEMEWCKEDGVTPPDYDPRFRPWYSLAASGGKDVVMVIDRSGSMYSENRADIAKKAALAVLDTLTWADYANVVFFSAAGLEEAYGSSSEPVLLQMTDDNKQTLRDFVEENMNPGGGTHFKSGFDLAFDILKNSRSCSNCNSVILMMTDGDDSSWNSAKAADVQAKRAELGCNAIMTYALGSGVSSTSRDNMKGIACDNNGIFYEVADGGNLADTMSSYFEYIASGTAYHEDVRWVMYNDFVTKTELFAGCKSAFDRSVTPPKLIGVTCTDVNVIADLETLRAQSTWSAFAAKVTAETAACYPVQLSPADIEALRLRSSGAGAVCNGLGDSSTTVVTHTCSARPNLACPTIDPESSMVANRSPDYGSTTFGGECKEGLNEELEAMIGAAVGGVVVLIVACVVCCAICGKCKEQASSLQERNAKNFVARQQQGIGGQDMEMTVQAGPAAYMQQAYPPQQQGYPMQQQGYPMQQGYSYPQQQQQQRFDTQTGQPLAQDPSAPEYGQAVVVQQGPPDYNG
ncbi:hypothetical protein TrLO_g902 [Triparma laevis f. longispina]|uniref:VWFA domain-containing protein n=1 Tax=Triparma laevis f. longispina TaxID=1714387 RepID=A0A9W7A0M0_9STRA|nr:hypothetical protein TrLO_g902 [Triparma laevis f. longispina]